MCILSDTNKIILYIDCQLNDYLNGIIKHKSFKALEARWRSLNILHQSYLLRKSKLISLQLLNCSVDIARKYFKKSQTYLKNYFYQLIYQSEYDQAGGQPFTIILIDWVFKKDDGFANEIIAILCQSYTVSLLIDSPPYPLTPINKDSTIICNQLHRARSQYNRQKNHAFFNEIINNINDYLWCHAAYLLLTQIILNIDEKHWFYSIEKPTKQLGKFIYFSDNILQTNMSIVDRLSYKHNIENLIKHDYKFHFTQYIEYPFDKKIHFNKIITSNNKNNSVIYTLTIYRIAHYIKAILRNKIGYSSNNNHTYEYIQNWLLKLCANKAISSPYNTIYPLKSFSVHIINNTNVIDCTYKIAIQPHHPNNTEATYNLYFSNKETS